MKNKLRVLLLFGGQSCEHEVSVTSARSMLEAIDADTFELTLVGIAKSGNWYVVEDPTAVFGAGVVSEHCGIAVSLEYCSGELKGRDGVDFTLAFDVVFPLLHGPHGEDGTLQGLLELAGAAYVGAGVVGSAVGMDKELMRRAFASAGLAQTPWLTVRGRAWRGNPDAFVAECESSLGYPVFVKPCNLGSSVGISKAHDREQLITAIDTALQYDYKAMVEQSVENGREIECSVLGNDEPEASPCGEIIPGAEFYNYETKYIDDKSRLIIPAELADEVAAKIRQAAITAFQSVEAFGLSRVDFLLDGNDNKIYINEINTMPGFTPISMYPKLWQAAGLEYAELIRRLLELALDRHGECQRIRTAG